MHPVYTEDFWAYLTELWRREQKTPNNRNVGTLRICRCWREESKPEPCEGMPGIRRGARVCRGGTDYWSGCQHLPEKYKNHMRVMPGLATFLSLSMHIKHKPTESKVHVYASAYFEKVVALSFWNRSKAIPMNSVRFQSLNSAKTTSIL